MKDSRLIPRDAQRVHRVLNLRVRRILQVSLRFIVCNIFFVALFASDAIQAETFDAVSVAVTVLSEPAERGVSEANGRPAVAVAIDWDLHEQWVVGAHGYAATDAPAPQRPQSVTVFGGWRWSPAVGPNLDVLLIHHVYPGDFSIDWDYTELRVDAHFSRNLAVTVRATDDYYGIGGNSVTGALSAVRELTDNWYARGEIGAVGIDDARFDSYGYVEAGGGFSRGRWSAEVLLRANNADASPAFRNSQIDAGVTASVSYKLH